MIRAHFVGHPPLLVCLLTPRCLVFCFSLRFLWRAQGGSRGGSAAGRSAGEVSGDHRDKGGAGSTPEGRGSNISAASAGLFGSSSPSRGDESTGGRSAQEGSQDPVAVLGRFWQPLLTTAAGVGLNWWAAAGAAENEQRGGASSGQQSPSSASGSMPHRGREGQKHQQRHFHGSSSAAAYPRQQQPPGRATSPHDARSAFGPLHQQAPYLGAYAAPQPPPPAVTVRRSQPPVVSISALGFANQAHRPPGAAAGSSTSTSRQGREDGSEEAGAQPARLTTRDQARTRVAHLTIPRPRRAASVPASLVPCYQSLIMTK